MSTAADLMIECEGIGHWYGRKRALEAVSLSVPRGEVYALLGRNGSGKSSLVRCLLGQQKPTEGSVRLLGLDVWRHRAETMARIGVVPEEPDAPPTLKVGQVLAFFGRIYPGWDGKGVAARLRRFGIPQDQPCGMLSRGQKAQLSLALALGPAPELLVLDDPTLGLDPVARMEVYGELLGELADRGTTVFLTTHDLAGIEGIATQIGILSQGRILLDGALEDLKQRFRRITAAAALEEGALEAMAPVWQRRHGLGWEAVVSRFDAPGFQSLTAAHPEAETSALTLEELFIAVAGKEGEVQ